MVVNVPTPLQLLLAVEALSRRLGVYFLTNVFRKGRPGHESLGFKISRFQKVFMGRTCMSYEKFFLAPVKNGHQSLQLVATAKASVVHTHTGARLQELVRHRVRTVVLF